MVCVAALYVVVNIKLCIPYLVSNLWIITGIVRASLVAQLVKDLLAVQETGFNPWVGNIPWRRKWQPTPVFLPGESHGQRSLAGYSPWGCKESDMTE